MQGLQTPRRRSSNDQMQCEPSMLQVQARQVNALLRKSWAYQRKNICSNIFILVAPIVICALLGVIQTLLDNLISDDAKVIACPASATMTVMSAELCLAPDNSTWPAWSSSARSLPHLCIQGEVPPSHWLRANLRTSTRYSFRPLCILR